MSDRRELDVTVPVGGDQDAALLAASRSDRPHRLRVPLPPESGGEIAEGNFWVTLVSTDAAAAKRINRTYHLQEATSIPGWGVDIPGAPKP